MDKLLLFLQQYFMLVLSQASDQSDDKDEKIFEFTEEFFC